MAHKTILVTKKDEARPDSSNNYLPQITMKLAEIFSGVVHSGPLKKRPARGNTDTLIAHNAALIDAAVPFLGAGSAASHTAACHLKSGAASKIDLWHCHRRLVHLIRRQAPLKIQHGLRSVCRLPWLDMPRLRPAFSAASARPSEQALDQFLVTQSQASPRQGQVCLWPECTPVTHFKHSAHFIVFILCAY